MKKTMLTVLAGVLAFASQANAHVSAGGEVVTFDNGDVWNFNTGHTSSHTMGAGVQPAFGAFYKEGNIEVTAIGFNTTGTAPKFFEDNFGFSSGGSHLHGPTIPTIGGSVTAELAGDAGGAVYRVADYSPFALTGLDLVNFQLNNAFNSATMRGYTDSGLNNWVDVNMSLDTNNNIVFTGASVATETGPGFNGTHLHLDDVADFQNIYQFEYFYNDKDGNSYRALDPQQATSLQFIVDNVEFAPAAAAVPVPAAVYLFGTALMGMLGLGKKRRLA